MRRVTAVLFFAAIAITLTAQPPNGSAAKPKPPAAAAPGTASDLPVRKVVLYKNGVGYFEHARTVNGNQRVAIDFTSSQLNDVLQSLTVLDSRGGMVSAVKLQLHHAHRAATENAGAGAEGLPRDNRCLSGPAGAARGSDRRGRSACGQAGQH